MSAIEVYRGAGDRLGAPVIDLLLSDDALIHRGRAEMDANAHQTTAATLSIVMRPGVRLGQLIEARDPDRALPYRGRVVGMQVHVMQAAIEQTVDLEVPL